MADEHPYAKSMAAARELTRLLRSPTTKPGEVGEAVRRHRAAMDEGFAAHPAGQANAYGPPVGPEE